MSITATQPESIGDPLWCVSWKSELSVASVCFTYRLCENPFFTDTTVIALQCNFWLCKIMNDCCFNF